MDFSDIMADPVSTANPEPRSSATPYAATGTILRVTIIAESWDNPGTMETLHCGSFEIDGMDYEDSPDGSVATIAGASVPIDTPVRHEIHSQGWEEVTLSEIAQEIARRGGLSLTYELDDDPFMDRMDQRQEGDLAFLQRICEAHGAKMKVLDNTIVIFDEAKYEARSPIVTFKRGDKRLLSFKGRQDSSNTANSATTIYKDPKSGKLVKETFTPPWAPAVDQALIIPYRPAILSGDPFREKQKAALAGRRIAAFTLQAANNVVDDFADIRADARGTAIQQAKTALRNQNKKEWICNITAMGNPRMCAGSTFLVEGYGVYDGKYIADTVKHNLTAAEYTNDIEGHRVLEGY